MSSGSAVYNEHSALRMYGLDNAVTSTPSSKVYTAARSPPASSSASTSISVSSPSGCVEKPTFVYKGHYELKNEITKDNTSSRSDDDDDDVKSKSSDYCALDRKELKERLDKGKAINRQGSYDHLIADAKGSFEVALACTDGYLDNTWKTKPLPGLPPPIPRKPGTMDRSAAGSKSTVNSPDCPISDKDIAYVSSRIGHEWILLGDCLGMECDQLRTLLKAHNNKADKCCAAILNEWRQNWAKRDVSVEVLCEALRECGREDLIDGVQTVSDVSDHHISFVSSRIGMYWPLLGLYLGTSDSKIKEIHSQNIENPSQCCISLLMEWKKSTRTSFQVLSDTLKLCGRDDINKSGLQLAEHRQSETILPRPSPFDINQKLEMKLAPMIEGSHFNPNLFAEEKRVAKLRQEFRDHYGVIADDLQAGSEKVIFQTPNLLTLLQFWAAYVRGDVKKLFLKHLVTDKLARKAGCRKSAISVDLKLDEKKCIIAIVELVKKQAKNARGGKTSEITDDDFIVSSKYFGSLTERTSVTIGDEFPDFDAESTMGKISFHKWLDKSWGIFFSHPRDFTPVCTTELGRASQLYDEFAKRRVKMIALSCDNTVDHRSWARDVQAWAGKEGDLPYPIIADPYRDLAVRLGMLDIKEKDSKGMPLTCRAVFIIGPDKVLKLSILYPVSTGRNFAEILRTIDSLQLAARKQIATPVDWIPGERCMVPPLPSTPEAVDTYKEITIIAVPSGKDYLRMTPHPH